jgi:hypothetical protein
MVWIPECCSNDAIDVVPLMRNEVRLFCQKLSTNTINGVQQNQYNKTFVISKKCHIKDRSLIAQDSAINNGVHAPDSSKELVFEYFNVTNLKFNEVEWAGSTFKVLSVMPLASATLDGKKYKATDAQPFISILIALKKMS